MRCQDKVVELQLMRKDLSILIMLVPLLAVVVAVVVAALLLRSLLLLVEGVVGALVKLEVLAGLH
jgi:hypothetical protein